MLVPNAITRAGPTTPRGQPADLLDVYGHFTVPGVDLSQTRCLFPPYSRASMAAASRSRFTYGSPLTSTATRLTVPPVNR